MKKSKRTIPRDKVMVLVAKREMCLATRVRKNKLRYSRKIKHKNKETL